MLDLKAIRSDPERVKAALARRGAAEMVDELLALDARRRELLPEVETAQAERKALSKQVGERKAAGEDAEELIAAVASLKERAEAARAEAGMVKWNRNRRRVIWVFSRLKAPMSRKLLLSSPVPRPLAVRPPPREKMLRSAASPTV